MVLGKIVRIRNTTNRSITFVFQGTSPAGLHAHIGDQEVEEMVLEANSDLSSDIIVPWLGYGSVYLGEGKDSKLGVLLSIGPSPAERWSNHLLMHNPRGQVVCSFKIGPRGLAFMDYASVGLSLTIEGPEGKQMAMRVSPKIEENVDSPALASSVISGLSCFDRVKAKMRGQRSSGSEAPTDTPGEDVENPEAVVTNGGINDADSAAGTNDAATSAVAPASAAATAAVVEGAVESRPAEPENLHIPQGSNEDDEEDQNKGGKGKNKNKKGGYNQNWSGGGNQKGSGEGKGGRGGKGGYNQNWSGGGW